MTGERYIELLARIDALPADVDSVNHSSSYLPFRNKDTVIDYDKLAGHVIATVSHTTVKPGEDLRSFRERALKIMRTALAVDAPLGLIDTAYLTGNCLQSIAPEFAMMQESGPKATEHLAQAFRTLLWSDAPVALSAPAGLNFLERRLLSLFQTELLTKDSREPRADCYLPFLRDACRQDLSFLLARPHYFSSEKRRFLELYAFLYTSQLALGLRAYGQRPQPRPLYFILDSEKASRDRSQITDNGYKSVREAAARLFPILSVLNYFNPSGGHQYPLWEYSGALVAAGATRARYEERIAALADAFRANRKLSEKLGADPLDTLVNYSIAQFDKGTTREAMSARYVREFEEHFASPFCENRGRSGAVLVMQQDHLLLTTNLCIGGDEAVLFPELMRRFEARGIYWDQDSQVELVHFYRRVGNVKALSDTGEAVYVAKAI
jgi:DNA phosphorothioation-dependent restriction protein DptG